LFFVYVLVVLYIFFLILRIISVTKQWSFV
jgi:hypothetical protein